MMAILKKCSKVVNLVIDHYDGGYQAGKYLKELGHKKALCLADNFICMDKRAQSRGFVKPLNTEKHIDGKYQKTEKEELRIL